MSKTLFAPIIKNGEMDFGSEYNEAKFRQFLADNNGKKLKISKFENPVSDEMRGYVFGAMIPFLRQVDPTAWGIMSDDQIYEVLKKNFNYFEAFNPLTKRKERYGQSVLNMSCKNVKAMEFVQRVANWVLENYGQDLPNPEEYKKFRDSAPLLKNV